MAKDSIHQQITRHTAEAFGVSVHPHLFRHCGMTSLAIAGSKKVHVGAVMLGHASLATSNRFYNLAQTIDATRDYHRAIESLRMPARRRAG